MPHVNVGRENSGSIELYYEDHGEGKPSCLSMGIRSAVRLGRNKCRPSCRPVGVGVLGGLEAIRVLQKLGFKPRRSIELVVFTAEEPTRFGIGCLGSRMMAAVLTSRQAMALRDKDGRSLDELRAQAGFTGPLESVAVPEGRFHQFVELHIEQGPYLEQECLDVGLVTHIAAPASQRIVIEGEGGHAGGKIDAGPQRRVGSCS